MNPGVSARAVGLTFGSPSKAALSGSTRDVSTVDNPFEQMLYPEPMPDPEYSKKGIPTCGAKNRTGGGLCKASAGSHTDHPGYGRCAQHGGSSPSGVATAHNAELVAYVRHNLGAPENIDPLTAMAEGIGRAYGHVKWLASEVGKFQTNENVDRQDNHKQALTDAQMQVYGMYLTERRILFEMSATAVRLGLAAKQVELAERQGDMLVLVINRLLDGLGLTEEQRSLAAVLVPSILREIASM